MLQDTLASPAIVRDRPFLIGVFPNFSCEAAQKVTSDTMPSPRNPPFRAEQLGSLLRPDKLVKKRYDVAEGKADPSELKPLEDQSVRDIVNTLQECGIHSINDGEYRR